MNIITYKVTRKLKYTWSKQKAQKSPTNNVEQTPQMATLWFWFLIIIIIFCYPHREEGREEREKERERREGGREKID